MRASVLEEIDDAARREVASRPRAGKFAWRREGLIVLLSLFLLAVVYGNTASRLSRARAFYVSDSEVRFLMIRNWIEHGDLVYLHYASAQADPEGRLHPLGLLTPQHPLDGSVIHLKKGLCSIYPPLFPLLAGTVYRLLGFGSLFVLPVLAGLGTVLVTYGTAKRLGLRSRLLLLPILGLATPLLVYSVSFWDHSIHMFLTAAAGYWMLACLEDGRNRRAAMAGAALGLGVWFHELFLMLFLAVLAAALPALRTPSRQRAGRISSCKCGMVGWLILGFVPVAALWAVCNSLIYGQPGGPHLSGMNNLIHDFNPMTLLAPARIAERFREQLLGYEMAGSSDGAFVLVAAAYALGTWGRGNIRLLAPIACWFAAVITLGWLRGTDWAGGLFQATPLFIPALAVPRSLAQEGHPGEEPPSAAFFYRWIGAACLLFTLIVLVSPQSPGNLWGSRYLLTMLPFLVLLAAAALERAYLALRPSWRWSVTVSAAALIAVSLFAQYRGTALILQSALFRRELALTLRTVTSPVVVMDGDHGSAFSVASPRQVLFRARDRAEAGLLCDTLERMGITEFTYVRFNRVRYDRFVAAVSQRAKPFVPLGPGNPYRFLVRFVRRAPGAMPGAPLPL